MSRRRVTSHDVARAAGVSRATVSLVLNDVRSVSIREETRGRVLEAARRLGYVPHAAGRALVTQRTRNIGLVHSSFEARHLLLLEVIRGMTLVFSRFEHRLLVDTLPSAGDGASLLALTRAKHIDGLVMFESRTADPVLDALVADGFPVVLIGTLRNDRLCTVDLDNRRAAATVVEHLLQLGHRRIGCITHAPLDDTAAANRLAGCRDALHGARLVLDETLLGHGDLDPESGYRAMAEMLDRAAEPPTAVFVTNDTVALGAMWCLHERKLRIPQDVAVAGFDDIPPARYYAPPLTSLRFSAEEEGRRAAEMLLGLIDGEVTPGSRVEIATELVVRESTAGRNGRGSR